MGRLFISRYRMVVLSVSALSFTASPALAEVCDKILGEEAPLWLMHASLWIYVVREFFSVVPLILLGIAILNLFEPGMRWLTLGAAMISVPIAWISVQENLYPHPIVEAAREEGCGGSYLAGAIVSPTMTAVLLASFFYVTLRKGNS